MFFQKAKYKKGWVQFLKSNVLEGSFAGSTEQHGSQNHLLSRLAAAQYS